MAYLLAAISGLLLFLSYPPFNLSYLAFIAFLPLFVSLKGKSLFKAASLCFLFGLVFFGGLLFWVNLMDLYMIERWHKPLLWLLLISVLSLYPALFGLLYGFLSKRGLRRGYIYLGVPVLWCSLEFIRSHFPLGGFPWGLLGYSQYLNLPLIQIASFTGALGISFLVMITNTIIFEMVSASSALKRKVLLFTLCFLLFALCYAYGRWALLQPSPSKNLRLAAVQGNFDIRMSWEWEKTQGLFRRRLEDLTRRANQYLPAMIVWSESVILDPVGHLPELAKELGSLVRESGSLLLVGALHFEECRRQGRLEYNSAFLLTPYGKIIDRYDKIHLVPFGESLPGARLIPDLKKLLPVVPDFTPGSKLTIFRIEEFDASFGVLICFEDVFGGLVRRFIREGADFMVNITNDAWSRSAGFHYQHFQASIFRAVENRIYILRAGNTGVSAIIDPYGRIEQILPINTAGIITGEVSTLKPYSFYTRWGDLFAYLCLGVGGFLIFLSCKPGHSHT